MTESLARFGVPEYLLELTASKETIGERKKVKEEKEELNEDDQAEIKKWQDDDEAYRNPVIENYLKNFAGRCNVI